MLVKDSSERICIERLVSGLKVNAAANFLTFLIYLALLRFIHDAEKNSFLVWFAITPSLVSAIIYLCLTHIDKLANNTKRSSAILVFTTLLNGALWGGFSAEFAIHGDNLSSVLAFTLMLVHLLTNFSTFMISFKHFFVFVISSVAPIVWAFLVSQPQHLPMLLIMVTLISGLVMFLAHSISVQFKERIQLQSELSEQNRKVEEANQSKSRFLASASHDLRQPLQALGFYIVLLSEYLREPKKKAIFDKTLNAYQALENLLNQLLNISKLNANLIEIENSAFSLQQLFTKLHNDYEIQAADKGLSIEFKSNNLWVFSDITCCERILRNLIENALRYTKYGFIKIEATEEFNKVLIKVVDTGIGIGVLDQKRIFEEFFQVKNPERDRSKGFGLGLYAVSQLTRLLNTQIEVISEENKGSEFSFKLTKSSIPQADENQAHVLHHNNETTENQLFEKVVMLVDDDEVVLDSISRLFLNWGCLVVTADGFDEAILLVEQDEIEPDILIVDYRLPDYKTGVMLIKQINEYFGRTIPAIVLTGDTGKESLNDIKQSGVDYLHKPADVTELRSLSAKLLS